MDETQRARFESLFQLYEHAWRQFNERRTYEFKVLLTFWTALAAGIAGSFTLKEPIHFLSGNSGTIGLCILGVVIVGLFVYWTWGLSRAHRHDRQIAMAYEPALQELINVSFIDPLKRELNKSRGRWGSLLNWSPVFQIGITTVLTIALLIAIKGNNAQGKTDSKSGETTRVRIDGNEIQIDLRAQEGQVNVKRTTK